MMIITRFTRKINLFYLFFLRGIERNFFLLPGTRRNFFSLRQKCCLRLKNKPGAAAGLMIQANLCPIGFSRLQTGTMRRKIYFTGTKASPSAR